MKAGAPQSDDAGSVGTTSTSVGIYNSACAVSSKIVSNSAATERVNRFEHFATLIFGWSDLLSKQPFGLLEG